MLFEDLFDFFGLLGEGESSKVFWGAVVYCVYIVHPILICASKALSLASCSPVFRWPILSAALVRQLSSSLIVVLLLTISFEVVAASLAREKTEESDVAVLREPFNTASHLLSRLRAWIITVSMSAFDGVVLVFFVEEGGEHSFVAFDYCWYFVGEVGAGICFEVLCIF